MSEIPKDVRRTAADIMDNACLGEHWVKNGVDGALRQDIARAILDERERCAKVADAYARAARIQHAGLARAISDSIRSGK